MSDATQPTNGKPAEDEAQQARIVNQFVRDLSFENPLLGRVSVEPGEKPELNVEVNVSARHIEGPYYESAIEFSGKAQHKDNVLYEIECVYAGIFQLVNIPDEAKEPLLLVNSPMLLFPYLRRIVSDITREGGFPPLYLDPIDFAGLYQSRKQQAAASEATS